MAFNSNTCKEVQKAKKSLCSTLDQDSKSCAGNRPRSKDALNGPLILMGLGSAYERETKVAAY